MIARLSQGDVCTITVKNLEKVLRPKSVRYPRESPLSFPRLSSFFPGETSSSYLHLINFNDYRLLFSYSATRVALEQSRSVRNSPEDYFSGHNFQNKFFERVNERDGVWRVGRRFEEGERRKMEKARVGSD